MANISMALGSSLKARDISLTAARTAIETAYGNAKAFVSLVQEGSNLREKASIALDLMSIPAKKAKNLATIQEGLAAKGAAVGNGAFAASLTAVATAAAPLIPAIISIGFAIGGLGLAIAAPFIAITALIVSFTQLFAHHVKGS